MAKSSEALPHITLQPNPSEFPNILYEENFFFFFSSVVTEALLTITALDCSRAKV
jgi:hypothetical protein